MSLKKLHERDALAVDAILMNGRNMDTPVPIGPVDADRIRAASKILQLLDGLADETIPLDLASRTLQHINESSGGYSNLTDDRPRPMNPNA